MQVREATGDERQAWAQHWERRTREWYAPLGALALADNRIASWAARTDKRVIAVLTDAEAPTGHLTTPAETTPTATSTTANPTPETVIGYVAACTFAGEPAGSIVDVWVDPAYRGKGHGRALRDFAVEWIRTCGVTVGASVWGDDPATAALFAYPVRSQRMVKRLGAAPVLPDGIRARPLTAPEFDAWHANEIRGYASDMAESGSMAADVALEEATRQSHALLPEGLATPGHSWALIEAEGRTVATIWVGTVAYPGLSWVYGVESDPAFRGLGYGRAAMLAGEQLAAAAGMQVLGLNVFGHNVVAIGLYTSLGYALVEQSRHL